MTPKAPPLHPLAREYLERLDTAARRLPRRERHELLSAIEEHLAVAHHPEGLTETEVRNMLEDLGDPDEVVDAAAPPTTARPGALEIGAVVLLLGGAFVLPAVGWLIGVILLWSSSAWTRGQKWLGTLVVPGGLAAPVALWMLTPTFSRCEAVADVTPAPPPPPDGAPGVPPSGGFQVDQGNLQFCSEETLMSTWFGIVIAVLLVAAALAVGIHLLRSANRTPAT